MSLAIGSTAISDVKIGTNSVNAIYVGTTQVWGNSPAPATNIPFYVEDVSGQANTVSIIKTNANAPTLDIETSTDNSTWTTLGQTSTTALNISIPANSKVYVRCSANRWSTTNYSAYYNKITSTGNFKAGGNTMSLLYGSSFTGNETVFPNLDHTYTFFGLFYNNTFITDASDLLLPATNLADSTCCYKNMFYGCTALTAAPALPATIVGSNCYETMFNVCTALATAPALPATTLANSCYSGMFLSCTNLTTAPALPATTLANSCYSGMFLSCTNLTTAPALPATTLADYCYLNMFRGCTNLTTAPALNATTLRQYCYNAMFFGCSSLTTAPALPATNLANGCYGNMFLSCSSLTSAPALNATTLADSCYYNMFQGCSSLTQAPALPATTLANYCYGGMFQSCSNLNSVTCLAENITASGCTTNWLSNVAATGTFTKSANMSGWSTGASGIPTNWTVVDAQ